MKRGQVFTWQGEGGGRYKVIELGRDQAVLLNMDTNTTWTIQPEAGR